MRISDQTAEQLISIPWRSLPLWSLLHYQPSPPYVGERTSLQWCCWETTQCGSRHSGHSSETYSNKLQFCSCLGSSSGHAGGQVGRHRVSGTPPCLHGGGLGPDLIRSSSSLVSSTQDLPLPVLETRTLCSLMPLVQFLVLSTGN